LIPFFLGYSALFLGSSFFSIGGGTNTLLLV